MALIESLHVVTMVTDLNVKGQASTLMHDAKIAPEGGVLASCMRVEAWPGVKL
jgi:hypothetical protein